MMRLPRVLGCLVLVLLPACHCNFGPNIKCVTTHGMEVALYNAERPKDAPSCADVARWTTEVAQRFEVATCAELPRTTTVELIGWLVKSYDEGVGARCTFGYPSGNWQSGNRVTVAALGATRPSGGVVDRAYQESAFKHELTHMFIDALLGGVSRDNAWNAPKRTVVDHSIMESCNLHR